MKTETEIKPIIISEEDINKRIDQIEAISCDKELKEFLIAALESLVQLDHLVGMKSTTIQRLRKIFNKTIESKHRGKRRRPKHPPGKKGRHGKKDYPKAPIIIHPIKEVSEGQCCPECACGHLSHYKPGLYMRIEGRPLLSATEHRTEKLRCTACHAIFEADFQGKEEGKYDALAKAIIVLCKYGLGLPFYRLAKLQTSLLTPVPASTQWDLVEEVANVLHPVWQAILILAAESNLYYTDDTKNKILALIKENKEADNNHIKIRKGIFTTCIIAITKTNHQINLFFTGRKYSGENLKVILDQRNSSDIPTVMSDAHNCNNVKVHEVIKALCLVHGRRKFFDLDTMYQEEANYVLDLLKIVFDNEAKTQELGYSPQQRLEYHQANSQKPMDDLKQWMQQKLDEKKVEPNSSLGKGFSYMQKNWKGLTAFLHILNAPLHNNIVERMIRTPVLHRKNSLFFKSELGALINDIHLCLIKTCETANVSPLEYLVWVLKNKDAVKKDPTKFFPWNFVGDSPPPKTGPLVDQVIQDTVPICETA